VDDLELCRAAGDAIGPADLYAALVLRAQVFVVEQACAYLDPDGRDLDPTTTHLWLRSAAGEVASYLRVLAEPGGGQRIGRVVTAPAHRGHGLSARLIEVALEEAQHPVVLHAQSHLVSLYARSGFVVDGPELLDDGIPHTPMRLP
jgi:ElaA protein